MQEELWLKKDDILFLTRRTLLSSLGFTFASTVMSPSLFHTHTYTLYHVPIKNLYFEDPILK